MDAGDIVSRNASAAERHRVLASFSIAGDGVNVFIAQIFYFSVNKAFPLPAV